MRLVLVLSEASLAAARRERGLVRSDGALRRRRGQVDPLAVGAAAGWGRGAWGWGWGGGGVGVGVGGGG